MKMNLHIESLVLEGLPIDRAQGPLVKTAIQKELGRLFMTKGLSQSASGSVPSLPVSEMNLTPGVTPRVLGRQIARVLYAQVKR